MNGKSKIIKKRYLRVVFEPESSLSIGSGDNDATDKDVIRDSRGMPFVPASALAGVYAELMGTDLAAKYLGNPADPNDPHQFGVSDLLIYDGILNRGTPHVTRRDMVALDQYKTAIPGAKFDMETVEPGVQFVTFVEQNIEESSAFPDEEDVLVLIAKYWSEKRIRLGAKTRRGYGAVIPVQEVEDQVSAIMMAEYDLTTPEGTEAWLEFDMYGADDWKPLQPKVTEAPALVLGLKQVGGISVRVYTTNVQEADYKQLTYKDGTPIIPGTSWAGAVKARIKELSPGIKIEKYFGEVKKDSQGKTVSHPSIITFGESQLEGGVEVKMTRNAIDRFTGGTVTGKLYTEKTYYGGKTMLRIAFSKPLKRTEDDEFINALAAAIADLHNGFLAVGGLTSVGRGMFTITSVNSHPVEMDSKIYETVRNAISTALSEVQEGTI